MPKNIILRLFTRLTGAMTPADMATRELGFEQSTNQLVYKRPDGTLVRFGAGGGNVIPQPYIANPTVTNLRDALVLSGVLLAQPTYSVSGQITGAVQSGVALALVGAQTFNATSDGAGNFTFAGVPDGTYTLTPTLTGYGFTPGNRTVTVAGGNVTAQNFVSVEYQSTQRMSSAVLFIPNGGLLQTRRYDRVARTHSAVTGLPSISGTVYAPTTAAGRHFIPVPDANAVYVLDDAGTLKTTINVGFQVRQCFPFPSLGVLVCVPGSGACRFVNYNFTTDVWSLGTLLTMSGAAGGSTTDGVSRVWVGNTNFSPNRLWEIDVAAQTAAVRNLAMPTIDSGGIDMVEFGEGKLFVTKSNGSTSFRIIDATTFADVTSNIAINNPALHSTAYTQGHFWICGSGPLRRIHATTGALSTVATLSTPRGIVADDTRVYVADLGSWLREYNASTATEITPAIGGFISANFSY